MTIQDQIAAIFQMGSVEIRHLNNENYTVCMTHGSTECEVNFRTLLKLSKLLGTDDINLQSRVINEGCDTCGNGSSSEITIYVSFDHSDHPLSFIAAAQLEEQRRFIEAHKARELQDRLAKEAARLPPLPRGLQNAAFLKEDRNPAHACRVCGETKGVSFAPNPYNAELYQDFTKWWMCELCRHIAAGDI